MSDSYSNEDRSEIIREARKKALRILEFSDRTEKQLRDKLREGDFPPFAVEDAVDYVKSFHYLDDKRFAENYIRNRSSSKSRSAIRYELKEKGVDSYILEELFEENPVDEAETVKNMFTKKYGHMDLSDRSVYEKALRYFASKGFPYEKVKKGITDAIEELESYEE